MVQPISKNNIIEALLVFLAILVSVCSCDKQEPAIEGEEICLYIEGGWPENWKEKGFWVTIGPSKDIPKEWIIELEGKQECTQ